MRNRRRSAAAAAWFGATGVLLAALWVVHGPIAWRAAFLFLLLPAVAAALAGFAWGGAVLDPARTPNVGAALLRGLLVAFAAFVLFAVSYSVALTRVERGWSIGQAPGLLLMTLTLGALAAGPLLALFDMLSGAALFYLGRRFAPSSARQMTAGR